MSVLRILAVAGALALANICFAVPNDSSSGAAIPVSGPAPAGAVGADLSVSKSDAPDPVGVGQQLTYTLIVTNNGPQKAFSVFVSDPLPASVAFVSAGSGCSITSGVVTCQLGDLAENTSVSAQIVVVPQDLTPLLNTASTSSPVTSDFFLSNNLAAAQTTVITDCNNNGVDDTVDITTGTSTDCNSNGVPDECDIATTPSLDCNNDNIIDSCELVPNQELLVNGGFETGNFNGWQTMNLGVGGWQISSDACEGLFEAHTQWDGPTGMKLSQQVDIPSTAAAALLTWSHRLNSTAWTTAPLDFPSYTTTTAVSYYSARIYDTSGTLLSSLYTTQPGDPTLETSCSQHTADLSAYAGQTIVVAFIMERNQGSVTAEVDAASLKVSSVTDCDNDGVPDSCEFGDCNNNGILDRCEIAANPSIDCDNNGVIDSCEFGDCNGNQILDKCELAANPALDCDNNGVIDSCEFGDCNTNGILDRCEIATTPSLDCNLNGELDECEIATTPSLDCNHDGLLDSCEPPCVVFCDETFTTGSFDPAIWLPFGDQIPDYAITTYDENAGAYLATVTTVSASSSPFRSTGIFDNSSGCIPYSAVGTANYVKGKFYVYRGGQSTNAQNEIPMLRMRVASRFGVNSMLEVNSHIDADPQATALSADVMPSSEPTSPSLYRVDFDPVDVPALNDSGDSGKLLRGFEAFATTPQDNGFLALTEIVICVYPAASLPPNQSPDQVLTTGTVDAGSLAARDMATDVFLETYNTSGPADISEPRPTYAEGPGGITLDTSLVSSSLLGVAEREFNPGPETTYSERLRAEPCKIYKVRFHVTSTQQTNLNAHLRLRSRTIRFNWTQKFEMGGAYAAGPLTNIIAQQAMPGIGCQNPDKDGNENGGWYTVLMNTPLSEDIRPEFAPGTPLATRMPNLAAEPGPGVSQPSLLDIRFAMDIVDTQDNDYRAPLESGNMTVDRIEVRSYPLISD